MSVPPKFASAYTASKSVAESESSHSNVYRFVPTRKENFDSAVADEEDGWIAVGPKHHSSHGGRKSFGPNDDNWLARKKFNERRSSRGSFSKTASSGAAVRKTVKAAAKEHEEAQQTEQAAAAKETEKKETEASVFEDDDEGEWTTPAPKKTARRKNNDAIRA